MSQPSRGHKTVTIGLISFGSNVATRRYQPLDRLRKALADVHEAGLMIRKASQLYHTPFFPANQGADFVNAAAVCSGDFSASEALERLQAVENDHNRVRGERWADRTLDLDLIFWGEDVLPDLATHDRWRALPLDQQKQETPTELILPHPRLQDRAFVLVPMKEILPTWVHPVTGDSVDQMLNALPESDKSAIKPLGN